jgi:hypothetical protein
MAFQALVKGNSDVIAGLKKIDFRSGHHQISSLESTAARDLISK